jgi:tetratricopeptide (TPR) repeat protein
MEQPKDSKTPPSGGLSARDIFASEETINRLCDRVDGIEPRSGHTGQHARLIKILGAANVVLLIFIVVYVIIHRETVVGPTQPGARTETAATQPAESKERDVPASQSAVSEDPIAATQFAQELYEKGEYEKARACYMVLRRKFTAEGPQMKLLCDYMQYKIALCHQRLKKQTEAARLLAQCSSSASPVVSVMSNYRLAVSEMQEEHFASARQRLYACMAMVDALPEELQPPLEKECELLLAEATADRFFQLANSKVEMPGGTWERSILDDPAAKMGYEDLIAFVAKGSDMLPSVAVIGQKVQPDDKSITRWNVSARSAAVGDLISGLGARAAFNVRWDASDVEKSRMVSVRLVERTPDAATEIIAGSAGLMVSLKNGVPTLTNPEVAMTPDQLKHLYSTEAISLLNRFILLHTRDDAAAVAYYAVGLIHEQSGAATAAISDYKIVSSRYPTSPAAQQALWNSSRIRLTSRDEVGAMADLNQLLELNPEQVTYCKAAMRLAQLAFTNHQYKESEKLFRKIYSLNPPVELQAASALGAARSLYECENNFEASEWFTRYIQLEKNKRSADLYEASLSLGICYRKMDKLKQSSEAIRFAMARELTTEQRMKAGIELARTEIEAESYVKAIAALQSLPVTPNLTDEEITVAILSARVNCEIGMPEKATVMLQNAIDRAYNKERATRLASALADAYIQVGAAEKAATALTKAIETLQPSPAYYELSCKLAEVDIALGRNAEAISLCTSVIAMKPSDEMADKAFKAIGKAYTNMKQYDKAAMAYAGKVSMDGGQGI